jgi:hypothetical protein
MHECDFDTHKCNFHTHEYGFDTYECDSDTSEYEFDTYECYFITLRENLKLTN